MSVSEQLPTYHSPNSTLTLTCYQLTVVELGEGWVHSCSDTGIDLTIQLYIRTTQSFPQICVVVQNELLHFMSIIKLLQQPSPGMNNTICSLFFHLNYEDYPEVSIKFCIQGC